MGTNVVDVRELLGLDDEPQTNSKGQTRDSRKSAGGKIFTRIKENDYVNRGSQRCVNQRRKARC